MTRLTNAERTVAIQMQAEGQPVRHIADALDTSIREVQAALARPDGPWRNPCPVCGTKQPPCPPTCGFQPVDEDLELPADPDPELARA